MVEIARVRVEKFKRASEIDITLGDLNVLVGPNNSGKSSAIQSIHFLITLFQSIDLVKRWQKRSRTSVFPEDLIYSPSDDPYRLYEQGRLQQNTFIKFTVTLVDGQQIDVDLTKGKNANLSALISPVELAKSLASLTHPYSIFSPGLAGIARREQYASDGVLLRAVSRGDANLFLRNILYRLHGNEGWAAFKRDIQSLFGEVDFRVDFEPSSQELIIIDAVFVDRNVPLESCGTELLQAIQILSYVHYFRPSLIILDEPDSHLHPNNQRLLCEMLAYINSEYGSKVILTTHSRHMLDALQGKAQFIWVQDGKASVATPEDHLEVLMDLGALDIKEVAQTARRAYVLTEDKKVSLVQAVLDSSGFIDGQYALQSYFGVTEPHKLQVVVDVIKGLQPHSTVIVHRDRDFMEPDEVAVWEQQVRALGAEPFITADRDIEDYYLRPDYLVEKNANLTALEAADYVQRSARSLQQVAIVDYTNGRLDFLRKSGERNINHGQIAAEAARRVGENVRRVLKGKKVRGATRALFQAERGANLRSEGTSVHLGDDRLRALAGRVFR